MFWKNLRSIESKTPCIKDTLLIKKELVFLNIGKYSSVYHNNEKRFFEISKGGFKNKSAGFSFLSKDLHKALGSKMSFSKDFLNKKRGAQRKSPLSLRVAEKPMVWVKTTLNKKTKKVLKCSGIYLTTRLKKISPELKKTPSFSKVVLSYKRYLLSIIV